MACCQGCEELSHIQHWFDVWHVAKAVKKKIDAKGLHRDYTALRDWSHSVSNHRYWCAASSKGCGELVVAKWQSVLRHVVNIHQGDGDIFPCCEHEALGPRMWMQPG